MADEERKLLQQTRAHLPPADRHVLSFDQYDDLGVAPPVEDRVPNRAMVQGETMRPMSRQPSLQNTVNDAWATSPLNPDYERGQSGERAELQRIAAKNPRSGSPIAAGARAAVTRTMDTLASPVVAVAKAVAPESKAAHLSAGEALADAESLVRGETTAESRDRAALGAAAHPVATKIGEAAGDAASALVLESAAGGRLRSEAARAFGGSKASQRGMFNLSPRNRQILEAKTPPDLVQKRVYVGMNSSADDVARGSQEVFGGKVNGLSADELDELVGHPARHTGTAREGLVSYDGVTGDFRFSSSLKNEAGESVGYVVRSFYRDHTGKLVADHSLFELDPYMHGKGIGKNVLRDQVKAYDKIGVNKITTEAEWDGRVVWPSMGFDLADKALWPQVKKDLRWYLYRYNVPDYERVADGVKTMRDVARIKTELPSEHVLRNQEGRPKLDAAGKPIRLKVSGEDFLRNHLTEGANRLEVDLDGESGEVVRRYLGLPARGPKTIPAPPPEGASP